MKSILKHKILRFQQKSGWCGPAVIQMALLAGGIKKSQKEIAKDVCFDWWGTSHDMMYAYLSKFYKNIDFQNDSNLKDISRLLKEKKVIIANWWDDLDPKDTEGHYSLILSYNKNKSTLTLADPSEGRERGIWEMNAQKFKKRWYDYLDIRNKKKIKGWMLWVDPKTKIFRVT